MSGERGWVVYVTGLPGAGKSTLAAALAARLRELGEATLLLDGDDLRAALSPTPGYDDRAREDFYSTLGQLAVLAARQGLIVVVAATAMRRAWRDRTRRLAPRFLEVHVATPAAECRRRDPKGLWAAAQRGEIDHLPGLDEEYEPPRDAEVTAAGGHDEAALAALVDRLRCRPWRATFPPP